MNEWLVEADFQGPGDSRIARWVILVLAEDADGARDAALDAVPDAQIVAIAEAE